MKRQNVNIFSGKVYKGGDLDLLEGVNGEAGRENMQHTPPKTPQRATKMGREQESRASSIYGKLTPVYDPSRAAAG